MSWAMRRRLIVVGIFAAVLLLILLVTYFLTAHQAPSCTDGIQNQTEEGIDCGGTCTYLCSFSVSQPSVRFVRAVTPLAGRTDIVAYIDNPNPDAGVKSVQFLIELYDSANVVVGKKEGTIDLPPASTIAVFVPDFATGDRPIARAFLTLSPDSLLFSKRSPRFAPPAATTETITEGNTPRISALVRNPSTTTLYNVAIVATVYDAAGNVIAASQTVVPQLPAQGEATATFTWPEAFSAPAARADILPVLPLP